MWKRLLIRLRKILTYKFLGYQVRGARKEGDNRRKKESNGVLSFIERKLTRQ